MELSADNTRGPVEIGLHPKNQSWSKTRRYITHRDNRHSVKRDTNMYTLAQHQCMILIAFVYMSIMLGVVTAGRKTESVL